MMKRGLAFSFLLLFVITGSFPAGAQGDGKQPPITAQTAAEVRSLARLGRGTLNELAWSPNGKIVAIASSIGIWLYQAGNFEATPLLLENHTGWITSVAFS